MTECLADPTHTYKPYGSLAVAIGSHVDAKGKTQTELLFCQGLEKRPTGRPRIRSI